MGEKITCQVVGGDDILANSGQGRPLWGDIWTKISKMKNVAARQISGKSFPRRGK